MGREEVYLYLQEKKHVLKNEYRLLNALEVWSVAFHKLQFISHLCAAGGAVSFLLTKGRREKPFCETPLEHDADAMQWLFYRDKSWQMGQDSKPKGNVRSDRTSYLIFTCSFISNAEC